MGLVSSRTIDGIDGKVFLEKDISIVWGSPEFNKYTYSLVVPLLIFWTTVLVTAIYFNIVVGKKYIANLKITNKNYSSAKMLSVLNFVR